MKEDSPWMVTMIKKLGSREAVKEHMSNLATSQKGSKKPKSGTAALTPQERSERGKEAAKKRWQNHS